MRIKTLAALSILLVVGVSNAQLKTAEPAQQFKIDQHRPYVYLEFDHIGEGVKFSEDEPSTRIWLRIINNCNMPIAVRTSGVPDGAVMGEVGILHDIVKDPEATGSGGGFYSPSASAPVAANVVPVMPRGYHSDVSSVSTIPPGKAMLFSVPVTHVSKHWHMEIPFRFDFPRVRPLVGSEPKMVQTYSAWDLPQAVQNKLENKQ